MKVDQKIRQTPTEAIRGKGIKNALKFFAENERAISDYAERAGLVFELGDKWTMDMEKGRGTYDPVFFFDRGFSEAESMWATCHEIEHFRDWQRDPEAYADLYARVEGERRLDLLYHYINDILINVEEDRRFPSLWETRDGLYRIRILPRTDYSGMPRHLQFIQAILRERMLPSEPVVLSPDVRAAIETLRNIDGEGTDLIDLVSDPTAKPGDRFDIIRDYIEPLYERFFQQDLKERKDEKKEERDGTGDPIKGDAAKGGPRSKESGYLHTDATRKEDRKDKKRKDKPKSEEDYFAGEYDESEAKLPRVFSPEEARQKIEKEIMRQREEKKTAEEVAREQFQSQYGVSPEEIEDYAENYKRIEHQIKPLRAVFERIISTRKEVKRRLKERTDQGVIIDPSMIAQSYIDAQGGVLNSRTQLKIKREEFDENKPKDFEFTLICDLSGSMNENRPGGKSYEQRSSAILIAEALDEFEKKLKEERLERLVDLHVLTEVRGFHSTDEELKPLSDSIDFSTRVKISQRLESCTGSATADYKSLAGMVTSIDEETRKRIESKELKKVLLLITDGGSDDISSALEAKKRLVSTGVIAKAIQIGQPSRQDVEKFRHVWQRDGKPCRDVSQLTGTIEKLLENFLRDL